MKLVPAFFVACLLATVSASAQTSRDTVHHASNTHKEKIKSELNLSKDQSAKIKAAKQDYKDKSDKIKNDPNLSQAEKESQLKSLKKEKRQEVESVLTPEQREKAKEMRRKNKKQ